MSSWLAVRTVQNSSRFCWLSTLIAAGVALTSVGCSESQQSTSDGGDRATSAGSAGDSGSNLSTGGQAGEQPGASDGSGGGAGEGQELAEDDSPVAELDWEKPAFTVSSLPELQAAVLLSDQQIVMKAGDYDWSELPEENRVITFSGSNNTIDLVGVRVEVPVGIIRESYLRVTGSNNRIVGGEVEDVYSTGLEEVTDFYAYNQNSAELAYGLRGEAVLSVSGNDNVVDHFKLTVRGSFPYGYGSIYGIGAGNTFGLNKRCGIFINGVDNTISNTEVQQRAFCHGIYMQAPADRTTIINTLVEGRMRPSAELYEETEEDSLPARLGFMLPDPEDMKVAGSEAIPKDVMIPLSEDGIRAYNGSGSVIVENSVVKKMRGGIRLYLATSATVSDSKAVDCGHTNYNMPADGVVTSSSGNFAYAPLSDFRLSRSRQDLEITILPSPHALGPHNLADVLGGSHNIVFHRTPGPLDTVLKPIVVPGNNSTIRNETEYPIIVSGSGNTILSAGEVTDEGDNNEISAIELGQLSP